MDKIADALQLKNWAVVGATDNREKYGYKIFKFMKENGYNVYAVNPGVTEILGEKCYPTLGDLPVKPDAVDVVVPPRVGEKVMRECAQLGISTVWLQPGADASSVVKAGEQLNLNVIYDSCIMVQARCNRIAQKESK